MKMLMEKSQNHKQAILLTAIALVSFLLGANVRNLIPVATVNGEGIGRTEFLSKLIKADGAIILNGMLTEKLILQEAARRKVSINKTEISNKIKDIERNLKRKGSSLNATLVEQKQTLPDLQNEVKTQLLVEKMFQQEVVIRDTDIEKYFKGNHIIKGAGAILESQLISIREQLYQQKLREKFLIWIGQQRSNAKVRVYLKI